MSLVMDFRTIRWFFLLGSVVLSSLDFAPTSSSFIVSSYDWAQGPGSAPDVPHTELSVRKTEGSGVGVFTEPPVRNSSESKASSPGVASRFSGASGAGGGGVGGAVSTFSTAQKLIAEAVLLSFMVKNQGKEMVWESLLVGGVLFFEMPSNALVEGANDSFVKVMDYAEGVMKCSKVVVCFKKSRQDRGILIRTFMFLGFSLISPSFGGSHGDLLYMSYTLEGDDDSEEEDRSSGED